MKVTKNVVQKCAVSPIDPYTERWLLYEMRERIGKTEHYGCEVKNLFSLKVLQFTATNIAMKYKDTFEVTVYEGKTFISLV